MTRNEGGRTSPLLLAAAWVVVALPLAWGVYQTVKKSVPLFRATGVAEAPARPPAR
jgi:hypothetical protein